MTAVVATVEVACVSCPATKSSCLVSEVKQFATRSFIYHLESALKTICAKKRSACVIRFKFQRIQNFAFVTSRHLSRRLKVNHQYEGQHLREKKKINKRV